MNKEIVKVALEDTLSISKALEKYRDLLKKDLVNSSNEMNVVFVKEVEGNILPLQLTDGDISAINDIKKISLLTYSDNETLEENTSSEAILFSKALMYSELKEDLIKTAKEIVSYSRRHNDTWEMWADDMGVFGIDALYILAKKYPEYTYLIGGFIIPYWDDEHAGYVFNYLYSIICKSGFTDDLMKAFCYLDSDQGRLNMLGIGWWDRKEIAPNLVEIFRENPTRYAKFKAMLVERFKEQDYLQFSKEESISNPITSFITTIMASSLEGDTYDEDIYDNKMNSAFIGSITFIDEAKNLKKEIEELIGRSLINKEVEMAEVYEEDVWENFFSIGLGVDIWDYIKTGRKEACLEDIKKTDIIKLSKEKELLFYKEKIQYYIGGFDTFIEEFHNIFQGFIDEYYEEEESNLRIFINGADTSGRAMVIRALDVFYRLLGKPTFTEEISDLLVSYGVVSIEEFVEKYDKEDVAHFSNLLAKPLVHIRYISKTTIDRLILNISKDRELTYDLLTGIGNSHVKNLIITRGLIYEDTQLALIKKGLVPTNRSLTLACTILERFYGERNKLTEFLESFISNNWKILYIKGLKRNLTITAPILEKIEKLISTPQPPSKYIMMKLLSTGIDSLSIDEFQELERAKPENIENSKDLIKDLIEAKNAKGDRVKIFSSISDSSIIDIIPTLYYKACISKGNDSLPMKNALRLLLEVDPIKVMKAILRWGESSIKGYDILKLKTTMGTFNQSDEVLLAMEILGSRDRDYSPYINMYIEDEPSRGMIRSYGRSEIEDALNILGEAFRDEFLDEVNEVD